MSQNGKVVAFGKVLKAEAADVEILKVEELEPITEREAAIVELATFLLDNKDKIDNFVCGVALGVETVEDDEQDTEFHVITSPIEMRDYALALRLFEDSFKRRLGEATEE